MRPLVLGALLAAAGCEQSAAPVLPGIPPVAPATPVAEPPSADPPAVPTGLRVSASGEDFVEWTWNAVEGADGYDVQFSANEAFTDEDEVIARTAEQISYRRQGLAVGSRAFLRVRSASGSRDDRITSDWSTHVTGMTAEPPPNQDENGEKLSPCPGVTVYTESAPIVYNSGWRAVSLVLEVEHEEAGTLNMDWGYPYYSGSSLSFGDGNVYRDTERLQPHVSSWAITLEGSIVHHVLHVEWPSSFQLRFRSRRGYCGDMTAVTCDEDGCSLAP